MLTPGTWKGREHRQRRLPIKRAMGVQAMLKVFCLPYAGGSAQVFRSWCLSRPSGMEIVPLEFPGRGSLIREPVCRSLEELVLRVAEDIESHRDGPYVLFGHSLGALVAFEASREMTERGDPPNRLVVSAHRAPQVPLGGSALHDLPRDEFVAELRRLNGTPDEVLTHSDLMDLMLPILRADFRLTEEYEYHQGPQLECPISSYVGLHDSGVRLDDVDPWRRETRGDFIVRVFSGGHFFLNTASGEVLEAVQRDCADVSVTA